jgi:hypothetical protein
VSAGRTDPADALAEVVERPTGLVKLIDRLARRGGVSRRGLLVGAAVAGSALATDPKAYALLPQTAYATICGPANTASSGWTIFCATVNKGVNGCPPGSFTAGWWKAADSSWCGGGYRYIVDCNAKCTRCTTGCSDHICDSRCWNCSCTHGSTATCDQRVNCCNAFRYGQCNTQVKCSGGVHCRVVSCVAPYKWDNCSTTSFRSDATAEHSSPYLPAWGPMERLYVAMGAQRSYLRASAGPIRYVGDGRGRYVTYQGGRIWWTSATGAVAMTSFVLGRVTAAGGTPVLGYPLGPKARGLRDEGWIQVFEKGAVVDSGSTRTCAVHQVRWTTWVANGRENGVLGYPVADLEQLPGGAWIQRFQNGCLVDGAATPMTLVHSFAWRGWVFVGRETGPLGFPTGPRTATSRGWTQPFQGGGMWSVTGKPYVRGGSWTGSDQPGYAVWGAVLDAWRSAGGPDGRYGYPTAHVVTDPAGTHTGVFEHGSITV